MYDDQLPTRFGVLPRYAKNEDAIRWFEVPAVMMFHVANAWQEGNTVKLVSCCFDEVRSQYPHVEFKQQETPMSPWSQSHVSFKVAADPVCI